MYPPQFDYRRPSTVEEALGALEADGARVLAGGHSLVPALKERATDAGTLVDVSDLDALAGIERRGDSTVVGAATTYADTLDDGTLAEHAPAVAEAIAAVGDRQIRNRGTVGGNLVQADPGADVPAAALAADASLAVRGPDGERTVPVAELYADDAVPENDREPAGAIGDGDLVTAVRVPDANDTEDAHNAGDAEDTEDTTDAGTAGAAYERATHPARGYATVGVAARVWVDGDAIEDASVAATGVRRTPIRLDAAEDALVGSDVGEAAETVASGAADAVAAKFDPDEVRSDPNVSSAYRLRLLSAYVERAVVTAIDRARGDDRTTGDDVAADGGRTIRSGDGRTEGGDRR